ncbi:hypothetical protein OROMI_023277 [Orobanche minor]
MGGGTIRAAAKVGGIAASTSGFRVSSAARKASLACPPVTGAENVKVVASNLEAGVQRPIDDWVFAGGEADEVVASADEPIPRVIFGGAPSLQEAKEATSELTVALENCLIPSTEIKKFEPSERSACGSIMASLNRDISAGYCLACLSSPNSVKYEGSFLADKNSSLSLLNKPIIETEASVASEVALPAPAIMAFRVLHESPMAQNVVASIASDPNVWNAVLQNNDLRNYLHSQVACSFSDENLNMKLISESDLLDGSSEKSTDNPSKPRNKCMDVLQKIKCSVVDMMNDLSDYFQSFFGGGKGANKVFVDSDGSASLSSETIMGASFIGLAVMAIVVVLLRRA